MQIWPIQSKWCYMKQYMRKCKKHLRHCTENAVVLNFVYVKHIVENVSNCCFIDNDVCDVLMPLQNV